MRLFVIVTAIAAVFTAMPAAAQTPPRKQTTVVYHALTGSELEGLLREGGYTGIERFSDKQLIVTAADGFVFGLTQTVCDVEGTAGGCLGINIQASWDVKASDQAALRPMIDTFNATYAFAKAMLFPDHVLVERYVITDGGVTLEHIQREVAEFLTLTELLEQATAEVLE